MPIYEYECDDCRRTEEVLVRRPDETVHCPACNSHRVKRLISVPATPVGGSPGRDLPVAGGNIGDSCGAPRCCGGGCQMP